MVRSLGLAVALILTASSVSSAAVMKASGTFTSFASVGGALQDPGIFNQAFRIVVNTNDATGAVTGGFVALPGLAISTPITPAVGSVVIDAAGTTWSGLSVPGLGVGGGTLNFNFATMANGLNDFTNLESLAGNATFLAPNNGGLGVYTAAITAVPEPSASLALGALVLGCGWYRRRRA